MKPEASPDYLRPDAGVRRLNRRPLAIVVLTLAAVVVAFAWGVLGRTRRQNARPSRAAAKHAVQAARPALAALAKDVPTTGEIPERPKEARFRAGPPGGLIVATPEPAKRVERPDPEREAALEQHRRLAERRQQMLETAMTAVTRVATVEDLVSRTGRREAMPPSAESVAPGMTGLGSASSALRSSLAGLAGGEDVNKQPEKESFAERKRTMGYLAATRQPPFSEFELKAGTVIPAVLISGVNSDLPGQILAQVTQPVYDSASGDHLLIPQGAKLVGVYDSRISVGQSRVQIAWTRLNFPDASTLELGGMSGADQAGLSGFNDRVNSHAFRIFRDALMMSFISAGTQLSQPRARGTDRDISAEQQIAAAMGQQFGAAGMELAKRNAQIQPTLEIRPGYRFVVMVNRDIVLRPYRFEGTR